MRKRLLVSALLLTAITGCSEVGSSLSSKIDSVSESSTTSNIVSSEENVMPMKLYFNEEDIPVIWENNETVAQIRDDAFAKPIVVEMSMYGGNEQFGSLGKTYPSSNTHITTQCGDIVLYNNDSIVVFYGSNTWSYTKLGKINLSDDKVIALLSNGDITLTLKS